MANETFESSKEHGPHQLLAQFTGRWRGLTRTFFEPDVLADESHWEGTIKPILNGMFLLHEYSGTLQGKPFQGTAMYGYNITTGVFESCWVDSFHNGTSIMVSRGTSPAGSFTVLGSYGVPDNSPPWGWRTTIQLTDADTLTITMFNITPSGEESKAVETIYSRVR